MQCPKCGIDNMEHAKYCKRCGASLTGSSVFTDRKKLVIGAAILLFIAAICIIIFALHSDHQKTSEYKGKLQTADKYLEELDYAKAEDAYLTAIKIEPKKEEAYIKLADTYTRQGKYDEAVEILEEGKAKSGGKNIEPMLGEVKITAAETSNKQTDQNKAYYDLCLEYQKKYGQGNLIKETETATGDYGELYSLGGLCVIQLLDFNGDDNKELLLAYQDNASGEFETRYGSEIWAWQDGTLKNVMARQPANDIEGGTWIETTYEGNKAYLVSDRRIEATTGSAEYLGYDGKEFKTVYNLVIPIPEYEEPGSINGKPATDHEVIELHNSLARPYYPKVGGDLECDFCLNRGEKRLYFPLHSDQHVDTSVEELEAFKKVLENTQKNLDELSKNDSEKKYGTSNTDDH